MATVSEPADGEIVAHYNANPALYADRKEYRFLQLAIDLPPVNADKGMRELLDAQLAASADIEAFIGWLNTAGVEYALLHRVASAEVLEPPVLEALSELQEDEFGRIRAADGIVLLQLQSARDMAMSQEDAFPLIRRQLTDQRRIEAATMELESLRQRADIEILLDPAANAGPAA
jgi:hypothetical protein